jgi:threonine aldolase
MTTHPQVDLRSDTVTKPTPEMRAAMAAAVVGDDVMGEDPTINRLQVIAADMMGMEAGLFVPSGTMGNLAAILAHCGRGEEIIVGNRSHIYLNEAGGAAALGGVHSFVLNNQADGTLDLDQVQLAVRPDDPHLPVSRLITLENTQNNCGGVVLTPEYMGKVGELARENGLKLHVDGARLFNAAVALNIPVIDLVKEADSVTFCLSKGLCAPVGSVLCGSGDFIRRALRARKQLGGGMRQAGILAAAGIIALEKMTLRLGEDHKRARDLAQGLQDIPGVRLETLVPQTNMVFFILGEEIRADLETFIRQTAQDGVLIDWAGKRRIRLVTHYWIDDAGVARTIEAVRSAARLLS